MMFTEDFEFFWDCYPRKVGKIAAFRAYNKARQVHRATQAELIDGIRRYLKGKPDYADFAHAATWLNQGRWLDQYGPSGVGKGAKSKPEPKGATGTMYDEWIPYERRPER